MGKTRKVGDTDKKHSCMVAAFRGEEINKFVYLAIESQSKVSVNKGHYAEAEDLRRSLRHPSPCE